MYSFVTVTELVTETTDFVNSATGDNEAASADDFTAISSPMVVVFNAGDEEIEVCIVIEDDKIYEDAFDEKFRVVLQNADQMEDIIGSSDGDGFDKSKTVVTILDNDGKLNSISSDLTILF